MQDAAATGLIGPGVGEMAVDTSRRRHSGRHTDSMESPPVSLKVKMHNDGRHVTLRRLTEHEAAAQRDGRRPEGQGSSGHSRRRNSSFSSSDGGDHLAAPGSSADRHWRRTEALEQQQAAHDTAAAVAPPPMYPTGPAIHCSPPPALPQSNTSLIPNQTIDPRTGQYVNVPPPPPIPGSTGGLGFPAGSVTSPGTETSGATEYANNRRRRRAERAQARLVRDGRPGGANTVEFT